MLPKMQKPKKVFKNQITHLVEYIQTTLNIMQRLVQKKQYSWPPKPPKYFSVGIFEYILASMPNVYLNV